MFDRAFFGPLPRNFPGIFAVAAGARGSAVVHRTRIAMIRRSSTATGWSTDMSSKATSVRGRTPLEPRMEHLGSAIGLLASVIERSRDFPGRVADVRRLANRLIAHRAELQRKLESAHRDARSALGGGREFCGRRSTRIAHSLAEEIQHAEALLSELTCVRRRLGRERRGMLHRINVCERLARDLPDGDERTRLLDVIRHARASLQTLTRGEAKHDGHAR